MEPMNIFYKELPVNEDHIFTANIAKKMTWEMLSLRNQLNIQ